MWFLNILNLKMIDNFKSGLIAGSLGAFWVLPIDILKTCIQSTTKNENAFEIIKNIYRRRIFIFMMQIHHKNIFVIHIIIAYRN